MLIKHRRVVLWTILWLVVSNITFFSISYMGCHPNPIDEIIFFKMVIAPPTSIVVELKGEIFGLPWFFCEEQVTREPHGKVFVENPQEPNMDLFVFQDSHYSDPSHDQTPVRWWEFDWGDLQLPELIWFEIILELFVDFLHFPDHGLPPRSPTKSH